MDRVAMVARCPLEAGCQIFRPPSQIGVGNRTRVHCSTREHMFSHHPRSKFGVGIRYRVETKDAVRPKVRLFCTSNDAGPWRTSAKDDLAAIAAASGADLGSVVAPEMSYEEAKAIVRESELTLPGFDDTIRECGLSELEASQF